jgi:DNA-binding PadR family transcriptional regulator
MLNLRCPPDSKWHGNAVFVKIPMTKLAVLIVFAEAKGFATPDQVRQKLQPNPDRRSFYSYLARLQKQGLLERAPNSRRGPLGYRITRRGQERITYLKTQ